MIDSTQRQFVFLLLSHKCLLSSCFEYLWSILVVFCLIFERYSCLHASSFDYTWHFLSLSSWEKGAGTFVVAHQASDTYYEHEINGLRPYQDYELAVQTYPTGFSHAPSITAKELPTTEPILCRTMEATPSRPRSFRVIEATTESVTIAWNPPRQLNGILRGYKWVPPSVFIFCAFLHIQITINHLLSTVILLFNSALWWF